VKLHPLTAKLLGCIIATAGSLVAFNAGHVHAVAYPIAQAEPEEYPYVVDVSYNPQPGVNAPEFRCTGALIARYFVLTAAHCVSDDGLEPEQILIGRGGRNRNELSNYGVIGIAVHPRYTVPQTNDEVGLPHDLALLHLAEPVEGPYLSLTTKNDKALLSGKNGLRFYGWGEDQNQRMSDLLGVTRQLDMSRSAKRWFPDFNPRLQIAAGWKIKGENLYSAPCFGDSGGPLVGFAKGGAPRLLGVVSYGATSCRTSAPVVYTRVSAYLPWIASARQDLAMKANKTALLYTAKDDFSDATGIWQAAEVVSGGVAADRAATVFLVETLSEPWTEFDYRAQAVIESYTTESLHYVDSDGLYDEEGNVLCTATTEERSGEGLYDSTYYIVGVDTTCLREAVGTTFDASIWLYADSSGIYNQGTSSDGVRVEFVIVPALGI
jgi:trypsin